MRAEDEQSESAALPGQISWAEWEAFVLPEYEGNLEEDFPQPTSEYSNEEEMEGFAEDSHLAYIQTHPLRRPAIYDTIQTIQQHIKYLFRVVEQRRSSSANQITDVEYFWRILPTQFSKESLEGCHVCWSRCHTF